MILSVIIPCYNHGIYIQEAIDSVLTYRDQLIEIIIIDDGSTDAFTISKMEELKSLGYHVIQQKKSGLSVSRNIGISKAKGIYILPLDADNRIKADYIRKALPLLENNIADIVYGKPVFFGDVTENRIFEPKEFDGTDLIFGNYIDACAMYKKEVWIKNNGYEENLPLQSLEDWDFWLNSYFNNFRFKYINEELYEYRVLGTSMIALAQKEKQNEQINFIMGKYGYQIYNQLIPHYSNSKTYQSDINHPLRSIFKFIYRLMTNKKS
ncbi:glycosyltransferase family 2 protein [Pedobacter agri]|uniref:glycosyltransferase family 2 protein n=1 Tax=Pedobacter agri TaxID=454586 RepID=UPI00293013BB|nr:glycosyltransferase family 2 protein [Pedobacter agri]